MSRKNHRMEDGRLLQTDKKYAHLKLKQKEKIASWMYEVTKAYYDEHEEFPTDKDIDELAEAVYSRISDSEIWIPYGEVYKHYKRKRSAIHSRIRRERGLEIRRKAQPVIFMNMCMLEDGAGNVLVLNKVNDDYSGVTFPGGHVEKGESYSESVIREVLEETGLTMEDPVLAGVYHWEETGIQNIVFLYKACRYSGELCSSEEGEVYWLPQEKVLEQKLAVGMERVWKIMHSEDVSECFLKKDGKSYKPYLF